MQHLQLERKLGVWACLSIVAGSVIGTSIFMKPATMAGQMGSPLLLLLIWLVAGVISIFGGMINAEIGTMLPITGGQYAWFRLMYGEFFAFLYGWASMIVINTAAIGAICFIAAQYTGYFILFPHFSTFLENAVVIHLPLIGDFYPIQHAGLKGAAMILVVVLTAVNHRSISTGGNLQIILTVLKIAALLFLLSCIFFLGKGSVSNFSANGAQMKYSLWSILTGIIAATSGALAAYDGWNNLGFVAGEIKAPQKNIPRGMIGGLAICISLYLLTTMAYLYMLPIDEMKNSPLVATDALSKAVGNGAASIIALLVILSAAGAANGNILPCARITFAMAKNHLFFPWGGAIDAKYHTPYGALWLQCGIACLFIITGSFDMLADLFVFVSWLFYGFGAYGIIILRKKMPLADRPYQLQYYPWIPWIFIFFASFYFIITVYNDIHHYQMGVSKTINSALGMLLLLTGVPFYGYFIKKNNAPIVPRKS